VIDPIFMVCTSAWAFTGGRLTTLTLANGVGFLGADPN
jgi:hypothetical protein